MALVRFGVVLVVLGGLMQTAHARPEYHPNFATNYSTALPAWLRVEGTTNFRCTNCHIADAGGAGCSYPPCFNNFGRHYRANNFWSTIDGWDSDGDGIINASDNTAGEGGPGWPAGADNVGCSINSVGLAASQTTDPKVVSCGDSNNYIEAVRDRHYVSSYRNGNGGHRFTFSFRCLSNNHWGYSPGIVMSDTSWSDRCYNTNECSSLSRCRASYAGNSCNNQNPGYDCSCNTSRFTLTGNETSSENCTDINECSSMSRCLQNEGNTCQNFTGSHNCICGDGFNEVNTGLPTENCVDINECNDPSTCNEDMGWGTCNNNPGGYTCVCATGYDFDGVTCVLENECTNGTNDCDANASCMDLDPGWDCMCNPGWTGTGHRIGRLPGCTNINECANRSQCGRNLSSRNTCMDTQGSYTCMCGTGFQPDGNGLTATCIDLDECDNDPGICGVGTCHNEVGSYTCDCPAGYAPGSGTCVDVDECDVASTCGRDLSNRNTCVNDVGTYSCICGEGFSLDGPDTAQTCIDTDECAACPDPDTCADPATGPCPAHSSCTNRVGTFQCFCDTPQWEERGGPVFECIDVDECELGTHTCSPLANCLNQPGGFECECQEGYEGNGLTCRDIDECASGSTCDRTSERCVNQPGIPDEHVCICAPGFLLNEETNECESDCGNGQRVAGEECDDNNDNPDDGCNEHCEVSDGWACRDNDEGLSVCDNHCGDGVIDVLFEECDDGALDDSTPNACRTNCRLAHCGDGVQDEGEECDEGSENDDFRPGVCRQTCRLPYCGDGVLDENELCDDGLPGAPVQSIEACTDDCDFPEPDAGTPPEPEPDAGMEGDAGDGTSADSDGCGCRTGPGAGDGILFLLLGLILLRRSRRRTI